MLGRIVCFWIAGVLVVGGMFSIVPPADVAWADTIEELREELRTKKDVLKEAESRIKKFKEEIQIKKKEARSLEDQIEIIDDNITQIRLMVDQTVAEIEKTESEIKSVEKEIEEKEVQVAHQKEMLAEYIRVIYSLNQQSSVAIFLKYKTFSEAVNETSTIQELQERSHEALILIKELKEELEQRRADLEDFKETLESLHERQARQQATLEANRQSKEYILVLTREQEGKYKELLEDSRQAHQAADAEIKKLDVVIREELRKQGIERLPSVGVFDWPVDPIFGVSCEFRCAGYPYAYLIGPHSGIDIPTYVGTPIRAPADGYIARVRNAGGPGYSYLLLLHGDNVSTVFGHMSGFAVGEGEMVSRGTVLGYTGGAPGTSGAGLSTGPHLHFEVRVNNSAVNPRQYL